MSHPDIYGCIIYNIVYKCLLRNTSKIFINIYIADSGENDAFSTNNYVCLLNGLIYTWRQNFNQPNLTFINIQLPGKVFLI